MRWGEWIIVRNRADLECLLKLSSLNTYNENKSNLKKCRGAWGEDEVIQNVNEVKRPSGFNPSEKSNAITLKLWHSETKTSGL